MRQDKLTTKFQEALGEAQSLMTVPLTAMS